MTLRHNEKNKTFYEFLETQLQLFKGHLMVTKASKDEEAIHQMRVAIKRIRTIQKLKKKIDFPVRIPDTINEAIKVVFQTTGRLRDLQIQTGLLLHYQKEIKSPFKELENYLTQLGNELDELISKTTREIDLSAVEELPGLPESDYQIDIEKESLTFLDKKMSKINHLIILISNEEQVHELRKQVKQLFFILQFLSEKMSDSLLFGYDLKALKRLSDALGFWNDRDFFRQMVLKFVSFQHADFLENNPEYLILLYLIEHEKRRFLHNLDIELYLEMIMLKSLLQNNTFENMDEPKVENTGKLSG